MRDRAPPDKHRALRLVAILVPVAVALGTAFVVPGAWMGLLRVVLAGAFCYGLFATIIAYCSRMESKGTSPAVPAPVLPARDQSERAVLQVAAENDGYVTPEAVVQCIGGLTLRSATELLEDLASAGNCQMEADQDGRTVYRFRTGVVPTRDDLTPEQWVEQSSRRLTGDDSPPLDNHAKG